MSGIGQRNGMAGSRHLAHAVLGLMVLAGVGAAQPARAQSGPPNPAATINGTVPTAEGNVWNGMDHQPTEAEVPQGSAQQQNQINNQLNQIDQQLMNAKMPKVPNGAPPVSGN